MEASHVISMVIRIGFAEIKVAIEATEEWNKQFADWGEAIGLLHKPSLLVEGIYIVWTKETHGEQESPTDGREKQHWQTGDNKSTQRGLLEVSIIM
jgi:hypothetical protein